MALENRHRAVTLVSVACSGADATGLFMDHDARERASEKGGAKVPPQLDQLADLICRGGTKGRTQAASYTLPTYKYGSTGISAQTVTKQWCPPANRKRPIDLVLLSIGGNDIGFGAVALYATIENARDLAPIAGLVGGEIRFGPDVAGAYLAVLDKRIKAVRDALVDGFGVEPSHVLQNAYEPIQFDEVGGYCDRDRHRLPFHHRAHRGLHQARHLRARSDPRADGPGIHENAAPLQDHRRLGAVFARGCAALRAPLAPHSQSERRLPHREHASRRHLAVRHSPAGIRGAHFRRVPSDGRGTRDRRRSRNAPRARDPRQGEEDGGRGAAELNHLRPHSEDVASHASRTFGERPPFETRAARAPQDEV